MTVSAKFETMLGLTGCQQVMAEKIQTYLNHHIEQQLPKMQLAVELNKARDFTLGFFKEESPEDKQAILDLITEIKKEYF